MDIIIHPTDFLSNKQSTGFYHPIITLSYNQRSYQAANHSLCGTVRTTGLVTLHRPISLYVCSLTAAASSNSLIISIQCKLGRFCLYST